MEKNKATGKENVTDDESAVDVVHSGSPSTSSGEKVDCSNAAAAAGLPKTCKNSEIET